MDEFLTIFRRVSESIDFKGEHLDVRAAKLFVCRCAAAVSRPLFWRLFLGRPGSCWEAHRVGRRSNTVAADLGEYVSFGIDSFILSGYPHLEEAYRVAELLFPLLPVDQDSAGSSLSISAHSGRSLPPALNLTIEFHFAPEGHARSAFTGAAHRSPFNSAVWLSGFRVTGHPRRRTFNGERTHFFRSESA
jgi:hypothetical protein